MPPRSTSNQKLIPAFYLFEIFKFFFFRDEKIDGPLRRSTSQSKSRIRSSLGR